MSVGRGTDDGVQVGPLIDEAAGFFYGNREYSDLPRKHKITIATCSHQCNAPAINCIALVGTIQDGRQGYALRVGGGLSTVPRISKHLDAFVPNDEALASGADVVFASLSHDRAATSRVSPSSTSSTAGSGWSSSRPLCPNSRGRSCSQTPAMQITRSC